jgi:hypothetical protein
MPDAIRTRCKFRVVGVEDTEAGVNETCHEAEPGFGEFGGYEYGTSPNRYKSRMIPGKFCQNVRLAASYDTANPEDVSFAAATPSGELKIYVSNPAVIGTFRPGNNYYLDLTPCE